MLSQTGNLNGKTRIGIFVKINEMEVVFIRQQLTAMANTKIA